MGMAGYTRSLSQCGLTDFQLYNAQGDSFDRAAVFVRIRDAVAAWVGGRELAGHAYPTPPEVDRMYEALRAGLSEAGLAACPSPFPHDLRATLLYGVGASFGPRGAAGGEAAEDGRAGS